MPYQDTATVLTEPVCMRILISALISLSMQIYAKRPKPEWWPLPEWNAAQLKKGRGVLEMIWTALPQSTT